MPPAGTPAARSRIRTPDQRVRVFISSTLAELAKEREAARRRIEEMGLIPVLFELGARPHPPKALYAAYLQQSHVFVGIYWQRYGWVPPGETISGLEDEYELSSNLPRLLYVKEPAPDRAGPLLSLLTRVEAGGRECYRTFETAEELARLLGDDLAVLLSERFVSDGDRPDLQVSRAAVPAPLTSTIGRRREIAALTALLRRGARLVTITGAGGVGKSRLAQVVASELQRTLAWDVRFVRLSAQVEPRLLSATVAEAVGAPTDAVDPLDALAAAFAGRPALLVLDNFEHLQAAAPDLAELLRRCAELQILVTSRHALRISGEQGFALAPLEVPGTGVAEVEKASAVRLFAERAAAVRPGFRITEGNRDAVAELCRRLDGLPLALELAAARLRLLEPDELLGRLGSRLHLLAGGAADLPQRQRALRATLDWSHDLLSATEKKLFARLSVFAGGATLAAAEHVCADEQVPDVMETMASLLEKSLLVQAPVTTGPARFQMLHVVRAYAWEQLAAAGEVEMLRTRHAGWYLDAIRARAGSALYSEAAWAFLDEEVDNLRGVLSWSLEQSDLALAAELAHRLTVWWWARGLVWEGLQWLREAQSTAARLAPASPEAAWIVLALGNLEGDAGLVEAAEPHVQQALQLFTAFGDEDGLASARLTLAAVLADAGRPQEAIGLSRQVQRAALAAGSDKLIEWASSNLATILIAQHDAKGARLAGEQALAAAERLHTELYTALAHDQLAAAELMEGRRVESWRHLGAAARIYAHAPHLEAMTYALAIAAAALLAEHQVDDAARAADLARELHERLRLPVWRILRPLHEWLQSELQAAMAGHTYEGMGVGTDPAALLLELCERHLPVAQASG